MHLKLCSESIFTALMVFFVACQPILAQPKNPVPPDLTKNKPGDIKLTYNLGATGLRGWIYTKPANFFESQ
ncbi:MAG: hypothetical protein EBT92_18015, partial [Planctomycetes bacterium]|nr:hypothetical protein [Planctomycetota bacterium]